MGRTSYDLSNSGRAGKGRYRRKLNSTRKGRNIGPDNSYELSRQQVRPLAVHCSVLLEMVPVLEDTIHAIRVALPNTS